MRRQPSVEEGGAMRIRSLVWAILFLCVTAVPAIAQDIAHGVVGDVPSEVCGKAQELGTGFVRLGLSWSSVEPNGPNTIDFGTWDQWFSCYTSHNIRIYLTVGDSPGWANGGHGN